MTSCDTSDFLEQARALHEALPVFVGYFDHCDEPFLPSGGTQADLEKLDAAGIRTFVASIGFGCYFQTGPREYELAGPPEWLLERQIERIDYVLNNIERCPRTRPITCKRDLETSWDDDSIGVIIHLTGNQHTLDLSTVDLFFGHGVRASHPAMPYHNRWCSGIGGMPGPVITDFGREVVARMNELGIVLDTAHASDESAMAILEASMKPVIDSHTTSRNLVPSSRGLRDDTLRAIADSGGVIGVHFADHMLTEDVSRRKNVPWDRAPRIWQYNRYVLDRTKDPDERMRLRRNAEEQEKFFREAGLPPEPPPSKERIATVRDLADVIGYLVNLAGIEHVGLGGDVNGIGLDQWPVGMDHVGELPNLTAELLRRGYHEPSLEKILAANWLRVYRECLPE